jgi:hypothetical protein
MLQAGQAPKRKNTSTAAPCAVSAEGEALAVLVHQPGIGQALAGLGDGGGIEALGQHRALAGIFASCSGGQLRSRSACRAADRSWRGWKLIGGPFAVPCRAA